MHRFWLRTVTPGARVALGAGLVVVALSAAAWAADPQITNIDPKGGQRGTEVEIKLPGARLADAEELLFTEPGITVTKLEAESATSVKATLAIAPDCRLGIHGVRVRTATGLSNLHTFHVGALGEINEAEPNSQFDQPQKIDLDVVVNGVVQNEDVDYYLVEAKKGERISAEIEGLRLGRTFFDPFVSIMNMGRFELAQSDDAPLLLQDSVVSIVAPEDGSYVIQVRESAYQGSGACTYRLHVGRFPRPTAVFPAGGRPGETLEVRWLGDPLGDRVESITLPSEPVRDFGLFAQDEHGIAPSPNPFRLSDLPNVLEAEPNDQPAEATPFAAPAALNGIISTPGDVDDYVFSAKKGQSFHLTVHARSLRSPLDSVLEIHRQGKGRLAINDDTGGPDSYIRFQAPEDDQYVIRIYDHLKAGGPTYVYRIEVTPIEPKLSLSLPERQQYVAVTVEVPQDNRTAVMVGASRVDFRGELNLSAADLPPGVAMHTFPMAENRNEVPVLFTAPADAAPAGRLAALVGRPTDEQINVEGRLSQRNWLVRGQNNREVFSFYDDRMPIALTKAAPFKVDVVQPKVPLVRDGSMQLKVVATRAEGFTAPIAVQLLYNPPGVSSSASVTIAEGQNEALIPLTANSGAELKTWPIVVTGRAGVDGGNVLVASDFIQLEVAEPYFGFAFEKAAVEQGQETELHINVEKKKDFAGAAKVDLVGLPAGTTSEPGEFNQETEQLVFKIKAADDAREGRHQTILCRAVIEIEGEPILHTLGTGELRVDKPLPPKVAAPAPEAKPEPAAAPQPKPEAPKEKPLSRLEQLRLEREREKQQEQESKQ